MGQKRDGEPAGAHRALRVREQRGQWVRLATGGLADLDDRSFERGGGKGLRVKLRFEPLSEFGTGQKTQLAGDGDEFGESRICRDRLGVCEKHFDRLVELVGEQSVGHGCSLSLTRRFSRARNCSCLIAPSLRSSS